MDLILMTRDPLGLGQNGLRQCDVPLKYLTRGGVISGHVLGLILLCT